MPPLRNVPPAAVHDLAVSPDGQLAAACGADQQVRVWTFGDGAAKTTAMLPAAAQGLAFSGDSRRLAVAADDGLVRVYDLLTGALLEQFAGHTGAATGVAGATFE